MVFYPQKNVFWFTLFEVWPKFLADLDQTWGYFIPLNSGNILMGNIMTIPLKNRLVNGLILGLKGKYITRIFRTHCVSLSFSIYVYTYDIGTHNIYIYTIYIYICTYWICTYWICRNTYIYIHTYSAPATVVIPHTPSCFNYFDDVMAPEACCWLFAKSLACWQRWRPMSFWMLRRGFIYPLQHKIRPLTLAWNTKKQCAIIGKSFSTWGSMLNLGGVPPKNPCFTADIFFWQAHTGKSDIWRIFFFWVKQTSWRFQILVDPVGPIRFDNSRCVGL